MLCRSFAGEALERERFQSHVSQSYRAGVSFAGAKVGTPLRLCVVRKGACSVRVMTDVE